MSRVSQTELLKHLGASCAKCGSQENLTVSHIHPTLQEERTTRQTSKSSADTTTTNTTEYTERNEITDNHIKAGDQLEFKCPKCEKVYDESYQRQNRYCGDCKMRLIPRTDILPKGFLHDGNLAFKCTYNDRNFRDICSDEVYEANKAAGRIWCNDPNSQCREFKKIGVSTASSPCYESTLFLNWSFGAGIKRGEKYYGQPMNIKEAHLGKLAFLTTRQPHQTEKERYIFGFLHMKQIANKRDPTSPTKEISNSMFVEGDPAKSLQFDPRIKLPFWKYYRNARSPNNEHWGTGLHRYLTDQTVRGILKDLREEYTRISDIAALEVIDFQITRYNARQ